MRLENKCCKDCLMFDKSYHGKNDLPDREREKLVKFKCGYCSVYGKEVTEIMQACYRFVRKPENEKQLKLWKE